MISLAIMGHGTVGSGVAEILTTHKQKLFRALGEELYIKYILDLRDFPDSPLADKFTKNFDDILNDIEVRIVVETMGGINPAYDFVKKCLSSGKSVVTSNKELVASKGAELLSIAKENNANFLYEASVGGGIPIIRPMSQCLVANNVDEIAGILNGTTNFIFSKMIDDNMSFEDALHLAQEKGYAERNPEADIEGYDACRKICILASLAYGKHIYPEFCHTEGITKITLEDVKYASAWGGVIKLIGRVKKLPKGKLDILVAPMLIPCTSLLSDINGVFNGVMVRGDCTGDVIFYGKGAGKLPTASAVVADIVDCGKHLKTRKFIFWADGDGSNVIPYSESLTKMFVRVKGKSKEEALNISKEVFESIELIEKADAPENEVAYVTENLPYGEVEKKLDMINKNAQVISSIRIGDF
ncbi:MAG: homoserine dehydrogenase [Acutalibacteraceae bacterium]